MVEDKKKITGRSFPDMAPIPVSGNIDYAPLGGKPPQEEPKKEESSVDWGSILVGATPALVGVLTGATEAGYATAGQGLLDHNTQQVKAMQAAMKARQDAKIAKDKLAVGSRLKASDLVKVDVAGVPTYTPAEDAVYAPAYEKPDAANRLKASDLVTVDEGGNPVYRKAEQAIGKQKYDPNKGIKAAEAAIKASDSLFDKERKLSREFEKSKTVERTNVITEAISKIREQGTRETTGVDDIALIFQYMKLLDPASTVRESEYANAANAGSIPEDIWRRYNRLKGGDEKLHPTVRARMLETSEGVYTAQSEEFKKLEGRYRRLAKSYGVNPENLFMSQVLKDRKSQGPQKDPNSMKEAEIDAELNSLFGAIE